MAVTQASLVERDEALGQSLRLLAHGYGVAGGGGGHAALVADPLHGGVGTVDLVCLGGGELGGNRGELQLGVDSVVEPGAACAPTI